MNSWSPIRGVSDAIDCDWKAMKFGLEMHDSYSSVCHMDNFDRIGETSKCKIEPNLLDEETGDDDYLWHLNNICSDACINSPTIKHNKNSSYSTLANQKRVDRRRGKTKEIYGNGYNQSLFEETTYKEKKTSNTKAKVHSKPRSRCRPKPGFAIYEDNKNESANSAVPGTDPSKIKKSSHKIPITQNKNVPMHLSTRLAYNLHHQNKYSPMKLSPIAARTLTFSPKLSKGTSCDFRSKANDGIRNLQTDGKRNLGIVKGKRKQRDHYDW
jgi:hypothetical protein